jgi:hypothetical protein
METQCLTMADFGQFSLKESPKEYFTPDLAACAEHTEHRERFTKPDQ